MRNLRSLYVFTVVSISLLASSHGQNIALHDQDQVVFYGDSITAQRLYTRFAEDFALTRYPKLQVTFFNAGVGGDTVNGGYTGDRAVRLNRDLFPRRPTVVTIMLGMNDGFYMAFDPKYLKIYEDGYRDLLKSLSAQAPSPRITLISPTPYDEVTHGTEFPHYGDTVNRYAASVKELAAAAHLGFSDFNKAETDLLVAAKENDPRLASLLVPDRIHPGEASHWLMAAELARTWGLSPVVSSVRIDAAQSKAIEIQRSTIEALAMKDGVLQWTQTDEALPLPLPLHDELIQLVLKSSPLADMDQQILRVDNLTAPRYSLKIDGREIASFTQEQLATGINLALYATPMESQAKEVDGIEEERTRLDETNFIVAVEDPKVSGAAEAGKVLALKDAALAAEQRKAALPKAHRFELAPQ